MSVDPFRQVLEATGYLFDGVPAPGVRLGEDARRSRRGRVFEPDASWTGPTATTVYFKYAATQPDDFTISAWHREIWNEGFAPLLWVISPHKIDLFNGFGRPKTDRDAARHRLRTFEAIEQQLVDLDQLAGRLAMETGQFWLRTDKVNRKTSVDEQLLSDLATLEGDLVGAGLERGAAQGLIGRSIFTQYLVDRDIVGAARLEQECGAVALPNALRNPEAAQRLFSWLADVFNGDMFPPTATNGAITSDNLSRVADFLEAVNPQTGQRTFFPYQFNVIPVELISSIYEQFAHSKIGAASDGADQTPTEETAAAQSKRRGVHYTRLPVVSLILDEVMNDATGEETVIDLTCGSGVFLVESLRRLVERKGGPAPARDVIRSALYNQIFGVDISEAAVRVAAFSLYLAALELDPDPSPPEALTFERLIGRSLLIGDARDIETTPAGAPLLNPDGTRKNFDVVVGNPPWTFRGKAGTDERRSRQQPGRPRQPRGEGLDFVLRAADFGHSTTRYGIVLSAMPFFAGSKSGAAAARYVVEQLTPVTIVNLAPLTKWLFPTAKMPAVVLLARHRPQDPGLITVVNVPWSPSAEKSYTFEIAPSDVTVLPLAEWSADPERLKTAVFGGGRDMILLDDLRERFPPLRDWLKSVGSDWRDGLILGKPAQRTRDASHLFNLPLLQTKDLEAFRLPDLTERFSEPSAQWPRSRETFRAPILLIKEFMRASPRPVTAVTEKDLVYTDAYFGAALPRRELESARLIAGILGSALATWFFLMTASEFGIWKRRLLTSDVGLLPLPVPPEALQGNAGRRILELERTFRTEGPTEAGLLALDAAVFELYGIDDLDQIVVRDGLVRAGWQWSGGRDASAEPATIRGDLNGYAVTFAAGLDAWLQSTNLRHVRGEVFDLPLLSPLRVVRFVIGDGRHPPSIEFVTPSGSLADVLGRIGERLDVRLGSALVGERELRVHGENEVVIIKPAARRFWMQSVALEDSDAVVSESFTGATA